MLLFLWLQYCLQFASEDTILFLDQHGKAEMLEISLPIMLGPLAQALVGPWITPQITFTIGVALSVSMALVAFLLLNNSRQADKG